MSETALNNNNNFKKFLQDNKEKINSITPRNPSIKRTDEWYHEDFWEDHLKELKEQN